MSNNSSYSTGCWKCHKFCAETYINVHALLDVFVKSRSQAYGKTYVVLICFACINWINIAVLFLTHNEACTPRICCDSYATNSSQILSRRNDSVKYKQAN